MTKETKGNRKVGTIIYLPPFLLQHYSCKNVPVINATTTTTTKTTTNNTNITTIKNTNATHNSTHATIFTNRAVTINDDYTNYKNKNDTSNNNNNNNNDFCHHLQQWEQKNYEKYSTRTMTMMMPSMSSSSSPSSSVSPIRIATTTTIVQQQQQQEKLEIATPLAKSIKERHIYVLPPTTIITRAAAATQPCCYILLIEQLTEQKKKKGGGEEEEELHKNVNSYNAEIKDVTTTTTSTATSYFLRILLARSSSSSSSPTSSLSTISTGSVLSARQVTKTSQDEGNCDVVIGGCCDGNCKTRLPAALTHTSSSKFKLCHTQLLMATACHDSSSCSCNSGRLVIINNDDDDGDDENEMLGQRFAAESAAETMMVKVRTANGAINISQTTILDGCKCFKNKFDSDNSNIMTLNNMSDNNNNRSIAYDTIGEMRPIRTATGFETLQQFCLNLSQTVRKRWTISPMLLMLMLILLLTSSVECWSGRQDVMSNCTFPARWEGSWFLSGYQQSIHIKGSQFSYRGKCAASDGNKYLIVDEKGCHRCLVIYEKHKNVLQYKESECEGDSMYMHQSNPSAMAMRSVLKQTIGDHRGGAHPNTNGGGGVGGVHSRLSSSDQYIMRSNDDMNDYFCKGRETLQNLCDQIPGDALLYSLFRESAEPVKCPLKGPFVFTYNRGHGECKSPVSNIESCTEDSRLLLSFQACPDVQGTESTVEELTCLATWKDGNSRYLVGLVSHHHAISNEERYRCFVYEKISSLMGGPSMISSKDAEYKLAQSGDATCNGLDSAEVGSRIMSLRKPPLAERCVFPAWFKGPRHWHALMGNAVYNYHSNDGSVHIIKSNGYMETRALCEQINKQTATETMAVVHYTTGCQSGFMCMMFYRRDTHVIEIQTGKQASRLEDACAPDHFDINHMPYITLLASNPDPQICPMEGLYNLRGAIGPPYLTTRHKRNHNNNKNNHGNHGHHHQNQNDGYSDGSASSIGSSYVRKRYAWQTHSALSFRNTDGIERDSWHTNTRGVAIRSRRNAGTKDDIGLLDSKSTNNATLKNNATVTTFQLATEQMRSRRDAPGCITNYKAQRQLWVGCTERNVIDVRPLCNDDGDEEYSCHGSWSENGTTYIIARHKGTKHGVCISYRPVESTMAKLIIGDACYRGGDGTSETLALKVPEHHLVANLSVFGKCGETGSASSYVHQRRWYEILAVELTLVLLVQLYTCLNHR